MRTIKRLLASKGNQVWSINPKASVFEAIELMARESIGFLVVLDAGRLVGVISERDYARKVILEGRSSKSTQVEEIMTTRVSYATPEQTVEECMAVMTERRFRHLPVFENEELVGVVSIGDLVKAIIADQKFIIEQLERYISG